MTGQSSDLQRAADLVREATSLIALSGAGMGVDSGLPDFRGNQGFWNAYPPYQRLGVSFIEMANPRHLASDPGFGWGFYGHRLELYRRTKPNPGFGILLDWARQRQIPYFAVTSNVDGQFQKAGFPEENTWEVHGSIHYLQCTVPCQSSIWLNKEKIDVNIDNMRAANFPQCPRCHRPARPNILMFGDGAFLPSRQEEQARAFNLFLNDQAGPRPLALEIGAGKMIPTIRSLSHDLADRGVALARVNPRDSDLPPTLSHKKNCVSLAGTGLEMLTAIHQLL